jgi:hypothetical protein
MTESPNSNVQHRASKLQDAAALALLAALVLLFFWRILTPRAEDRAIFPPGDFSDQFWMFRMYEARAFAQGRLPLWSENLNSGHPFLADVQSAIFYPVSLVWTLAVVAARGANLTLYDLELEAIFHFVLAGAFTYLFARRLLGSRVAALVSAITFTFGGYLTSYPPQQLAILETATWLPLALWLLERGWTRINADQKENPRLWARAAVRVPPDFLAAGVVLGIAALAGHPQTFLFVVYACAIFFVWRGVGGGWRGAKYFVWSFLPFAFSLVIAAGIAAAQWIPTLEYQGVSTRATIGWAEASSGFPTIDPLQMILPGFTSAFQSPLYIGVLPLWLALFALVAKRTREKTFWALFALGSLLVAFGAYAFVYALFYLFAPGWALFRDQERLAFVVSFALAILAGYGMRDLQSALDFQRARRAWALLPAGVTIAAMMTFTLYVAGAQRASGRLAFLTDRAGLMVLLFVLATALVAWRIQTFKRSNVQTFAALAIAFIAFDLFTVNNPAYNAASTPRYPETPLIQTIQNDRGVFRVADEGKEPGHFGIAYRLDEIGGISPLRLAAYNELLDNLPPEKLWRLLNVRYVLTGRPGLANAEIVMTDGDTRLLRLNNAMPRAWFVPYALQNGNDTQVLAAMSGDAFDPWYIAYVADATTSPLPAPPARRGDNRQAHAADFHSITPEHSRVSVNAPADGVLVLSENYYYPGWRATVDGAPAPIWRADVGLAAVPVRAGAQQVEFVFDPWSVKLGMAISAATVVLTAFGMAFTLRRRGT